MLAEVSAPPVEGINGWLIAFVITTLGSVIANVWSEYRRRSEAQERKESEKFLADVQQNHQLELTKLTTDADHRLRNEERWNTMFDRVVAQNKDLMEANHKAIELNNEQSRQIRDQAYQIKSLMEELKVTKDKLELAVADLNETKKELQETKTAKQLEIDELRGRIQTLENEVKSLEVSRDAARKLCTIEPNQG